MSKRVAFLFVLGALIFASFAPAQAPPAPQAQDETPRFASRAEVVAVDLVVRDKKGRLVTDLREDEIEILEDGVPQKMRSFRAIQSATAGGGVPGSDAAAAAAPAPPAVAAEAPRRVVLIFGRLSSDGRRLAQSAGEEFARKHTTPQTAVTVVRIDNGLIPVLDRASEPAAVKEAVREATAMIGGGPGRQGGPVGADSTYAGQQMSRFQGGAGVGDLSQSDSVALVNALITVVDGLKADAGRKTVLLFSEGFAVPPGYEHVFADLQSRANRANVSFYGVDVRGLQLSTQLGSSGAALATAATVSASQRQAGTETPATREQMTQDDTMQTSLRSDVVDALAHLSTSTGGFLVTQTNDFGRPLARVAEDIRGYYEASYVPSSPAAPGQFRKIEVRVARKDVRVQSRSGYYTTPPGAAGAFAAFAEAQLPSDFEVLSRFYRFGREGSGPFDCLIKVEASLAKAEFKQDQANGKMVGKIALVGRVLDGRSDVVDTFGQDVSLGGTREQIEASRAQLLPLARRLKLPPGNYTVELLVRDAVGDRSSGQRFALTVPAPEGELAMSSLVVVGGVEPADPKSDPTDPLRLGDRRIVPNLGRPVAAAPGATLPIYYAVYVRPGAQERVTATVEVSRDGQVVARGSSPLPPADAAGKISGLSPIPLQKLQPGKYDVKVTVSEGDLSAVETTTVTVGS